MILWTLTRKCNPFTCTLFTWFLLSWNLFTVNSQQVLFSLWGQLNTMKGRHILCFSFGKKNSYCVYMSEKFFISRVPLCTLFGRFESLPLVTRFSRSQNLSCDFIVRFLPWSRRTLFSASFLYTLKSTIWSKLLFIYNRTLFIRGEIFTSFFYPLYS